MLCLVAALVGCRTETISYRTPFDPATIRSALRSDQPYVISILGDSTGNDSNEWVHLVMQRVATTYNRPVVVHNWVTDANKYRDFTTYEGTGAPVEVWNGSAAGKEPKYSLQHYSQLAPTSANLTIINHSHNYPPGTARGVQNLVDAAYGNCQPDGGVVVILQNPRLDSFAGEQQQAVDQLRQAYSKPSKGVALIDVNGAFKRGDTATLLRPDGYHPNDAGERLWANTVYDRLFA